MNGLNYFAKIQISRETQYEKNPPEMDGFFESFLHNNYVCNDVQFLHQEKRLPYLPVRLIHDHTKYSTKSMPN